MLAERICPQCGKPLSPDALEGLCPRCVGRAAFDHPSELSPLSAELEEQFARLKPEEAGERIGPYKLLQQIGEGGFGVVWMAEQEKPVRRRVALKIIKLGMDTKDVIARFEQERQALAMMDHQNIAKVFDAGATQFGRPYFVMELVRGVKITDYCDQANLPTKERLDLFIAVCHAVQHAHQKGIIHRDLKPSNVLVTLHEIRRTIREQEPQTPSMFLKTMADPHRISVAHHRQSDPVKLAKLVRGDLDWIVMKALEKDRTRRYETATSFARDIERHLADVPVHARPASQLYRFRRFAKRNKLPFAAGLSIAAALVIGSGVSIWQAVKAHHESVRAQLAERAATENLWQSYIETARASIRTHDSGRRFRALEAVQKAAQIRTSPELRDIAAGALMLADLQRFKYRLRDRSREEGDWVDHSGDFESYALLDPSGHATLRRTVDDAILGQLRFPDGANAWPWLSPDARFVAVRGKDDVLRVRRWSDGATVCEVPDARGVGYIAGGQRIAVSRKKTIDEYSLTTGERTAEWACPEADAFRYSPDGKRLAVTPSGRKEILIFDLATGAISQRLPAGRGLSPALAWHPNQPILATSGEVLRVTIYNTDTAEVVNEWTSKGGHMNAAVFSADGGSLVTAGWDTHVRVWNWRTSELLVTALADGTDELRLSEDGRKVASRNGSYRDSSLYEIVTPEAAKTLAQDTVVTPHSAAFDPRGNWLAVCEDGVLALWTSDGRHQVALLDSQQLGHVHPHGVAFHPAKPEMLVASCSGVSVYPLIERPDAVCQIGPPHRILDGVHADRVAFSRDGALAAAVAATECLIYETATWKLRARTGAIRGEWRGPEFSQDGRQITDRVWQSGQIFVWDTSTGTELFRSRESQGPGPRFTPDGRTLLTGWENFRAHAAGTWRVTEAPLHTLPGETLPMSLTFSPDGTLVCTSVFDRVRLARWPSCELVLDFNCMPDPRITDLAISPDNQRLLVVGALGRVELVNLGALREELAKLRLGW